MASLMHKNSKTIGTNFPIENEFLQRAKDVEVPLFLYVFFSKRNCHDCLEIINILNDLPPHFIVVGVVPESELKNEKELRAITGAAFPLVSSKKYRSFLPWYAPTIIGVSPHSKVLFSLPGVPGETDYLKKFLNSLYSKIYPVFLQESTSQ
jgi:hypothetical protein